MPLPKEQEASYAAIIDSILAKSDLDSVSKKKVRKELADRVGYDVSAQKDEINTLIERRFDKVSSQTNGSTPTAPPPPPTANGFAKPKKEPARSASPSSPAAKRSAPSDDDSELSEPVDIPKPKKKRTKAPSADDDDAAFAARLQAEENNRARPTRGGGPTKKRAPVKKDKGATKKKKSAAKIKADDDSALESGSDGEPKERKGGFHKPFALSEPLVALLGETQLSRPQTVKKIWAYIKEHDLQDPSDKRQICCDDSLRAVFKQDRVHMFTMNKILNTNLYAIDEI